MRVDVDFSDKRLIYLDLVERKVLEPRQRGISGAEIVNGDVYPERLEVAQQRNGLRLISLQSPLGDLEFQPVRRESGFFQGEADLINEFRPLSELHRRQVDGDRERIGPCGGFTACLPQNPAAKEKISSLSSASGMNFAGGTSP